MPLIGSKEGIAHLALAYVGAGDVALIPEPGYLAYLGGSLLSEGEVHTIALRPRTKFLLELDDVPGDVLRRTRLVYLNYPNNPTAAIAPREYLERTVKRCREHDILLVYDNAYSRARLRRLRAAEHLRDRRRARRRDRVPLAVEDVQHDGLALRLGRGQSGDRGHSREGEVVRGYGAVHGGAGSRRGRARCVGTHFSRGI